MLVLTRKLDEQVLIGSDIKITLVRIKGNTVRLGIEAPDSVRVIRGELQRHDSIEDNLDQTDAMATVFAHPVEDPRSKDADSPNDPTRKTSGVKKHGAGVKKHGAGVKKHGRRAPVRSSMPFDWTDQVGANVASDSATNVVKRYDAGESSAKMKAAPLSGYMSAT